MYELFAVICSQLICIPTYCVKTQFCLLKGVNIWIQACNLGMEQVRFHLCTWKLPGGKGRPARKADNITAICEPTVWKIWEPRRLTTLWTSTACYRDSFSFIALRSLFHNFLKSGGMFSPYVYLSWIAWIRSSIPLEYFALFLQLRMTPFPCSKQGPNWEANRPTTSLEIRSFYGIRRFVTVFVFLRHMRLAVRFLLVSCLAYSANLKMKAICSSGRSVLRYNPEDHTLHDSRCENLKSNKLMQFKCSSCCFCNSHFNIIF
jgi:hypothetical protein